MKITLAFAIALLLQTISAVDTDAEKSTSSPVTAPSSAAMTPTTVGDSKAQELLENYVVFRWEANNTFAEESFEFLLNEPTVLQIVDFKHNGDMFDVFDQGEQIGSTSKVAYDEDAEVYAANPQESLTDDRFSKGSFNLDKGQHNVTILAYGPYDAGSAAIRLVQRTNLVLAKDKQEQTSAVEEEEEKSGTSEEENEKDMEEVDDHEEEEGEELEEEKEDATAQKSDHHHRDNWKKMYLQKKNGSKGNHHYQKHKQFKHSNGVFKKQQYHGHENNHRHEHGRPQYNKYHKASNQEGPKTVTHWEVVRKTAVPYAKKVVYEKEYK